ncbi:sulfotransferase 1E1-like [Glandiceps talaboti]
MASVQPPQVDVRTQERQPVIDGMQFPKFVCEDTIRRIPSMEVRDDDIWLVSYPKSGTHWMKGIIFQIYNHDTPEGRGEVKDRGSNEYFKMLEQSPESGNPSVDVLTKMAPEERRFIDTHLPPAFLPEAYFEKKPKEYPQQ